ncbi:MAG: ABC transporter substrate-binding protein [Proteobacteria bacterium]|nr:ABC transporter substrate-binding protein [Pseudomonadota bacterium]
MMLSFKFQSIKNLVLIAGFLAVSIGGLATMSNSTTSPRHLTIAIPKIEYILDPHRMEDAYSMLMNIQIHRGLFRYTPEGDVVTDLVQSWTEDSNHLRFVYKLKKSTFSDGTTITAEDLRQSLARIFYIGASIGADIEYVKGAKKFRQSKNMADLGIKALSPTELEINLEHPSALLHKQLAAADCGVLKITDFKSSFSVSEATAVSGPYKIIAIKPDQIRFAKWRSDSLDSSNPPEFIDFNLTDQDLVELAVAGKNDTLDRQQIPTNTRTKLMSSGWKEAVTGLTFERFVIMNPKIISLPTREYLFSKVNQNQLAGSFSKSSLVPAFGIIPAGIPGSLPHEDMDKARADAAKSSPKAPTEEILVEYVADKGITDLIASYLKEVWETPTLRIKLNPIPLQDFLKKMFSSSGSVLIGARALDYFDGYSVLTYFRSAYASNYFHVHDRAVDSALDKAVEMFEPNQRIEAYKNIQRMVLKHYTVIPLLFGSPASGLWSSQLKRPPAHPAGWHTLPFETIEMEAKN